MGSSYALLLTHFENGNINTFLRHALPHYETWTIRQPEILKMLSFILAQCPEDLTRKSVERLRRFCHSHPEDGKGAGEVLSKIPETVRSGGDSGGDTRGDSGVDTSGGSGVDTSGGSGRNSGAGQILPVGSAWFPAAATEGALYRIDVVSSEASKGTKPHRSLDAASRHLLDTVGAALFGAIHRHTRHPLIWNPFNYDFTIFDRYHRECTDVSGDSMGAALALALFSHLSGRPVPRHVVSTARVDRAGKLHPVGKLTEKGAAVSNEVDGGCFIIADPFPPSSTSPSPSSSPSPSLSSPPVQPVPHSFLPPLSSSTSFPLSSSQPLDIICDLDGSPSMETVRIPDLDALIHRVFGPIDWKALFSMESETGGHALTHLDLSRTIDAMNKQYRASLFDTCMENARVLIPEIERRIEKRSKKRSPMGMDYLERHLFHCLWKLGACHCHMGDVTASERYLKKADRLYRCHPGRIPARDYFNARNNYGVLLKDIFRYDAAEKVHLEADEGLDRCGDLLHLRSENLSSLSQLYLARHAYDKALDCQQRARKAILRSEQHRNLTYLAWIYTRMGDFGKAKKALDDAKSLIDTIPDDARRTRQQGFLDWAGAEYRYRKILGLKRIPGRYGQWFQGMTTRYDPPDHYVSALILKFSFLGLIHIEKGNKPASWTGLDRVRAFFRSFDPNRSPMMHLLGASVAIEALLARYRWHCPIWDHDGCRDIIASLSVHKNFFAHFKKEIDGLKHALQKKDREEIIVILRRMARKIPY